jgi:heme-degrading monooxygenase HmoA
MIYEMRTYLLKPGSVAQFEERFAEALPHREKYSKLGAFWHTEFGPLNHVIHVWPYEDLNQRASIRAEAAKDPNWPPQTSDLVLNMESEIMIPAPFMRPLGHQHLGNIYEMRIYTYQSGAIPEVLRRWSEAVPHREKYSPLGACWYSELGGLNKFYHIWPYKDIAERNRIRAEASKDPHWPAPTREFMVSQENQLLVPAAFSPMH